MSFIQIEKPRPHVTLVTLNRPERMNAMAFDVMIPLRDTLRDISLDNDCRVVVLTGAGHGFCSGADLVGGGMVPNISGLKRTSIARRALRVLDEVILAIRDMHQPVIAAVNGAAFGGGAGLVAAADIAIAADTVAFSFSEVRIGVIPAMISVVVLPKLGAHQTMRLFVTGARFDAAQALAYGLLHRVVPAADLVGAVQQEVDAIALGGPIAVAEAKRLVRTVAKLPMDDAFAYAEEKIAALFTSPEAAEGMRAFVSKEKPEWAR